LIFAQVVEYLIDEIMAARMGSMQYDNKSAKMTVVSSNTLNVTEFLSFEYPKEVRTLV
jgi:hypothetical protein